MSARLPLRPARLRCEQLESRDTPSNFTWLSENFDQTPLGNIPAGWNQWSNQSTSSFAVENARSFSGTNGLGSFGISSLQGRSWYGQVLQADFGVSAHVYLDSLQPLQLMVRGNNLDSATPTFYSLSINRGLQAQLQKTLNGSTTQLGTVSSTGYLTGIWVLASLKPTGSNLAAEIYRPDTSQYLNAAGGWQATETAALQITDSAIAGNGFAGVERPARYANSVYLDDFSIFGPGVRENFDTTPLSSLPAGWAQWSTDASNSFGVTNTAAKSQPNSLASTTSSSRVATRSWAELLLPPDVQVSAAVNLTTLIPARLLARGQNLNSPAPTYYAVQITRGLDVQLLRMVNGVTTTLGELHSNSYFSNQWVNVTLGVAGTHLYATVYRNDTGQYLGPTGDWQNGITHALDLTDSAISAGGMAGLERAALYAGAADFDDFAAVAAGNDSQIPTVTITNPAAGATISGVVAVTATATDANGIDHVEFYVDGLLRFATSQSPYIWNFDTNGLANGTHVLSVKAYDPSGNMGQASITCTVNNGAPSLPNIPRHYNQIRIAELAYIGTPISSFEQNLLKNSVDLVIPNTRYLAQINSLAPSTPQLIYTNVSNIYENLLTDWLIFADAHGFNREDAFYHVAKATPWTGDSSSSQPVNWFWSVRKGSSLSALTNLTSASHNATVGDVPFGALGESLYIGYPEKFRELNVNLSLPASGGWRGMLEYASATDAAGNPAAWSPLTLISDGTAGFTRSGQITFNPPANWKTAVIPGAAQMFYIRIRTIASGIAPIATTLLGRDYAEANGTTHGTIPAFDYAADANHDGYLDDAEYARRAPGKDARFVYESRLFFPYYGQMRFVTNPSGIDVQKWESDFQLRYLQANPLAAGLFVDNSSGHSPLSGISTLESTANYSSDYGALLGAIDRAIAPQWLAANTSGGGAETDSVIRNTPASVQESALRALSVNRQQFEDEAALIAHRLSLLSPSAYMVLDSMSTGGSPTDPRTQIATLAYYYLVGDPKSTFLMFFGGESPNTSWTNHWSPAAAYDIGQPVGTWSVFAQGADPTNANLTYKIYQRSYANALVLYKPLSYNLGQGTGTLSDATATTHQLNGTYRILNADGTLSGPVTSVTLRNGEGAILIKV